jgi:alpha,alpha-trehalase
MVLNLFKKHRTLVEKYDVCNITDRTEELIKYGYQENEIGFGWTNAVFLELYHILSSHMKDN